MSAQVFEFPNSDSVIRDRLAQVCEPSRGQLKKAFKPRPDTLASWKQEGQRRHDAGYTARWTAFWGRVVKAVALLGTVGTTEMYWVDQYVKHCRTAELHSYEAQLDPYQTYDSGYVAAHPGFAHARAEAKLARELAADLGLTPKARRAAGVDVPKPDAVGTSGDDTYLDDQVGPDGEAL